MSLKDVESVKIRNALGFIDSANPISMTDGFMIAGYDYVDVDYTDGNPTTVIYKTGGSGGTTVATLTITYTVDGCVDTVTKS